MKWLKQNTASTFRIGPFLDECGRAIFGCRMSEWAVRMGYHGRKFFSFPNMI